MFYRRGAVSRWTAYLWNLCPGTGLTAPSPVRQDHTHRDRKTERKREITELVQLSIYRWYTHRRTVMSPPDISTSGLVWQYCLLSYAMGMAFPFPSWILPATSSVSKGEWGGRPHLYLLCQAGDQCLKRHPKVVKEVRTPLITWFSEYSKERLSFWVWQSFYYTWWIVGFV